MNTPRSQRLQRVADIAGKRTDEAARRVAECTHALDAARRQLEELQQFRHDYAQPANGHGVSVAELLNRQQFVARIDQAIAQQSRDIEQHVKNLAKVRAAWLESRNRHAALDSVTTRYRDRERANEERAEQAALDDRVRRRREVP